MTAVVFADNCLLVNLAHIGRLDLFRQAFVATNAAAWTRQVARETRRSVAYVPGLQAALGFMPRPIEPTPRELHDTFALRNGFAKPGDDEEAHLGESETFAVIHARYAGQGKVWVATEDKAAAEYAEKQGWRLISTRAVLQLGVNRQLLTLDEANQHLKDLREMPRGVRGYLPPLRPPGCNEA